MLSDAAIKAILEADGGVASVLGSRIYLDAAPAELEPPYLVVSRSDDEVLQGSGGALEFGAVDYELVAHSIVPGTINAGTDDEVIGAVELMDSVAAAIEAITEGRYGDPDSLERVQCGFWEGAVSEYDEETEYFIRRGSARLWGGG